MYWAQEVAAQSKDEALKTQFAKLAAELEANEAKIVEELNNAQGVAMDIGGYFLPTFDLASKAMRPSATFNAVLASV